MSEFEQNLPSIRDQTDIELSEGLPGQELLNVLAYLEQEMGTAIDIIVEEARDVLQNADPSRRIAVLNRLNRKRVELESQLRKEIREVQTILNAIRARENPAVVEALEKRIRETTLGVTARLHAAMDEFEV
ncbi:MAG: hypothetical protein HY319_07210 [Armatimonadetes bacterium]|nr:hypothetical protein [Armatimonadota bacterium]